MKKLLSLLLVLSLCLSSVILLASCKGPSAYEVAVENGFTGSETEWLESLKGPKGEAGNDGEAGEEGEEGYPGLPGNDGLDPFQNLVITENYMKTVKEWLASLKGTDGKDGHNVIVTINENGYWVIDGTRQPVKVTGEPVKVLSVELVNNVFSVVKGNATAPQLEMKVKFDDGTEDVLPVSNSVIANTSYDLTKEGEYPVTLSYGGVTATDTITVEGLMVYFENFDSLSNTATMAEICAQAGFQIPVLSKADNPTKALTLFDEAAGKDGKWKGSTDAEWTEGSDLYWTGDGSNLDPFLAIGGLHNPNYLELKVESGRLVYTTHTTNGKYTGMTDSMLIIANAEEMAYASQETYTIQMDIQFPKTSDNGTPDDTTDDIRSTLSNTSFGNTLLLVTKFSKESTAGRPCTIGPAFGAQNLMANVWRKGSWYVGNQSLTAEGFEKAGGQSVNVLTTLFPESTSDNWFGEELTVRIVVEGRNSEKPGYTVYVKKAADAEDKFILVGKFNAETVSETSMTWYMKDANDGFGIQSRGGCAQYNPEGSYPGFYLDNIAAWTGNGNMPTNTSTATYEELNTAYNASLTPAA